MVSATGEFTQTMSGKINPELPRLVYVASRRIATSLTPEVELCLIGTGVVTVNDRHRDQVEIWRQRGSRHFCTLAPCLHFCCFLA